MTRVDRDYGRIRRAKTLPGHTKRRPIKMVKILAPIEAPSCTRHTKTARKTTRMAPLVIERTVLKEWLKVANTNTTEIALRVLALKLSAARA